MHFYLKIYFETFYKKNINKKYKYFYYNFQIKNNLEIESLVDMKRKKKKRRCKKK